MTSQHIPPHFQYPQADQSNGDNLTLSLAPGDEGHALSSTSRRSGAFVLGVAQYGETQKPRQTLVLLHGFTGSAASWSALLPLLAVPGRRIIALDLLGHGHADAPADPTRYGIVCCQADILATLNSLGVQSREAMLLGYSMGGRIALYTAFSGFFRALILESASPGLATEAEREQRRQSDNALAARIESVGVEAFIDYWEKLPLFASQNNLPAETRAALRTQRLDNRASGLANSLRGVGTGAQPALHERLPTLDLPTLLLAGELDAKFCQIADQMARSIPQASLHLVPGSGHAIHLEQPALFAGLVNEFCGALC
jgi:2-succinyl-6-hydroxy-2,4-cyclohexadiene-1-carboxylate synthase